MYPNPSSSDRSHLYNIGTPLSGEMNGIPSVFRKTPRADNSPQSEIGVAMKMAEEALAHLHSEVLQLPDLLQGVMQPAPTTAGEHSGPQPVPPGTPLAAWIAIQTAQLNHLRSVIAGINRRIDL